LLDDLARGVQVNETLVHLKLVTIPGLGTLTTRSLTGGDLEDLGGKADRALYTELLVLCTIDEIGGELFQVLDVAARQGDSDFVNFGSGDSTCCIVLLVLSDVTHSGEVFERGMSQKVTKVLFVDVEVTISA